MALEIKDIARRIETEVLAKLGPASAANIADHIKQLLADVCIDAALLQVSAMTLEGTQEAKGRLTREKSHVQAQLDNLAALGASDLSGVFWEIVRSLASAAVEVTLLAV